MMESSPSNSSPYLVSDLDNHRQILDSREQNAHSILSAVSQVLANASDLIDDLESDGTLGPTITRCCNDLADKVAGLARELDSQSDDERRRFARACIDDAQGQLALQHSVVEGREVLLDCGGGALAASNADKTLGSHDHTANAAEAMAALTEDDVADAITGAHTILLDVEAALRSVGQEEAEEIADVTLVVARMFVWSLQAIQMSVTAEALAGTEDERRLMDGCSSGPGRGMDVEVLDENDIVDNPSRGLSPSVGKKSSSREVVPNDRMRVLWPPVGPAVVSAGKWGADAASKKPLLSVVLGVALWPAAMLTAFVGAPVVAADFALQKGYDALSDGPLIETVERGAANIYQVGKLHFLCTKLVVKQGLRVGERQIKRHGGVGKVAQDLGGFALDRVLHPVQTACMAWDGLVWGAGALKDAGVFIKEMADSQAATEAAPNAMH